MKTSYLIPGYFLLLICLLPELTFSQYAFNGSARRDTGECFVLTPNQNWQGGSIWFLNTVNISTPFDLQFEIFLGCSDAGADGIAFVLQQVSTSVGSQGGGLGYQGIQPSIAIEFDTWENRENNDPFYDHIAIQRNGSVFHRGADLLAGPIGILGGNANAEDCMFHKIRITWNPNSNIMRVYVDCNLRLTYTGNIIANTFRNNPNVFWGFTGATGGARNLQMFCRDYVSFFQENQDTSICKGDRIMLDVGQGDTIRWTPSTGLSSTTIANPIASPDTTTIYTATIIDECGDTRVATVRVQVDELPIANAGPDTVVCGNSPIRLQGSGGVQYSWTPITGLSDPNISNPQVNPSTNTMYTVTVTDANGCVATDDVLVEIFEADAGPDVFTCPEDSIQIMARRNAASYQWSPVAGLSSSTIAQPMALPSSTTDYILVATHARGCTDRDTMRVNIWPKPNATITPDFAQICPGDSIDLEVNLANLSGITWTPATGLSSTISPRTNAKPTSTTTYTAIVRDGNGCQDTVQSTVTVLPPPIVDAGNDTVQCGNQPIQLMASGGATYRWSPASSLQNANTVNPLADPDSNTTYYVLVTDSDGCQNIDSVFVRAFNADAGPDVPVCIGDTTRLQAYAGPVAYQWNTHPSLFAATNIPDPQVFTQVTLDYILIATDTSGCTDTDTMRVIVNPLPTTTVTNPDQYVCSGGPTILTATGGVQYAWTPAATLDDSTRSSPTAFPINTGPNIVDSTSYYVTVTDANGCVNYDSIKLEVRLRPEIMISNDTFVCPGDTVPIWVEGGFGVQRAGWRFDGSIGDSTFISTTRAEANAFPTQSTYYIGEVEAIWGCDNTDSVLVYHIAPDAGEDSTICEGDSLRLQGGGGRLYSWSPATGLSNANVAEPWAFPATTTTYTVTVTDSLGCVDSDEVTITVLPAPPIQITGDLELCLFDTANLIANGGVSYRWITDDPTISSLTAAQVTARPQVDTRYILRGEGANGCFANDTVDLTINPLPNVDAGPDIFVCRNEPAILQGSGALNYSWTPQQWLNDPFTQNPTALPNSNTRFRLVGTDINGCSNRDSMRVIVTQLPDATVSPDDSICLYQNITFRVRGNASRYVWSTGEETQNITVEPRQSTVYWVIPYGRNDCPADTLFIDLYVEENLPRAAFEPEVTEGFVQLDVPFINESQFATNFLWEFGDDSTSTSTDIIVNHLYREKGQYIVTLFADNDIGCPDSVQHKIIDVWGEEVFLPTAFTPNEDGNNDDYYVPNGGFSSMDVRIFNRWGRLIYQSTDPNFRWDGNDPQGRAVPEGVYVIQLEARRFSGGVTRQTGTITLIR